MIERAATAEHFFIFSDVKANVAYSWQAGVTEVLLEPSGCDAVR